MVHSFSTEPPRPSERRGLIALLLESLDDEYEAQILRGAAAGARQVGATVLAVAGCAVDDPDPDRRARNFAFDLIDQRNVHGVIALTSAIASVVGPERMQQWLERYGDLAVCCAGVEVLGRPFVGVDNHRGARAVVSHLVEVHGAHRLALIRGPSDSVEARDRERAFRDVLSEAGIEVEQRLVLDGDFSKEAGTRAVRQLFDERGVRAMGLDALVAANDYMALGAMQELARRGLRVPDDVRVVGFDDVESAKLSRPGLTTVRQPGESVGRRAIEMVHAHLQGQRREPEVLPTEFVSRRSCGCEAVDLGLLARESDPSALSGMGASLVLRRHAILAELMRAGRGALGTVGQGWEVRLFETLVRQLGDPGAETLALAVDQLLHRWDASEVDGAVLQDILSVLRREALACVVEDTQARARLESLVHQARVVAAHGVARVIETRMAQKMDLLDRFEHVAHRTLFSEPGRLAAALEAPLNALGVEACVLAALDRPGNVGGDATVLFAFGTGPAHGGELTELWALPHHPSLQYKGRALVLLPIVVDGAPVGAAVVATNKIECVLFERLRVWFTTMLRVRALLG